MNQSIALSAASSVLARKLALWLKLENVNITRNRAFVVRRNLRQLANGSSEGKVGTFATVSTDSLEQWFLL